MYSGPQIHTHCVTKDYGNPPAVARTPERVTDRNRIRVINYKFWHFLFQIRLSSREREQSQPLPARSQLPILEGYGCMHVYIHIYVYVCPSRWKFCTVHKRPASERTSMMSQMLDCNCNYARTNPRMRPHLWLCASVVAKEPSGEQRGTKKEIVTDKDRDKERERERSGKWMEAPYAVHR